MGGGRWSVGGGAVVRWAVARAAAKGGAVAALGLNKSAQGG